jgi:hypothetical protein
LEERGVKIKSLFSLLLLLPLLEGEGGWVGEVSSVGSPHILHLYAKKLRRIEIHDKYYTKSLIF